MDHAGTRVETIASNYGGGMQPDDLQRQRRYHFTGGKGQETRLQISFLFEVYSKERPFPRGETV